MNHVISRPVIRRNLWRDGLALLSAAAVSALVIACAAAEAQPLEVTYYYLPG